MAKKHREWIDDDHNEAILFVENKRKYYTERFFALQFNLNASKPDEPKQWFYQVLVIGNRSPHLQSAYLTAAARLYRRLRREQILTTRYHYSDNFKAMAM